MLFRSLQAWSRGIPAVSFVKSGAKDCDGRSIELAVNTEAELHEKLRLMINDPLTLKAEGARSKQYFESNHTIGVIAEKFGNAIFSGGE